MQIIICSDSHGTAYKLDFLFRKHPNADMYLHLGDGERELDEVLNVFPDLRIKTYHVKGNCDFASFSPDSYVLPTEGGHFIYATHGYREFVHRGAVDSLREIAQNKKADIVLFGHTHCRYSHYEDGIWYFNPGSIAQPRDGQPCSYGILDVSNKGVLLSHGNI